MTRDEFEKQLKEYEYSDCDDKARVMLLAEYDRLVAEVAHLKSSLDVAIAFRDEYRGKLEAMKSIPPNAELSPEFEALRSKVQDMFNGRRPNNGDSNFIGVSVNQIFELVRQYSMMKSERDEFREKSITHATRRNEMERERDLAQRCFRSACEEMSWRSRQLGRSEKADSIIAEIVAAENAKGKVSNGTL